MIPATTKDAILQAIQTFDDELRESKEWEDWQQNKAHKYAVEENGQAYPVKQLISLATGMPVSDFSGGEGSGQANQYVRSLGFKIVAMHHRNPPWTRDELILALDFYLQHRPQPPGKTSKEIQELSETLNKLAVSLGMSTGGTFRNTNGVYMKLMNFRRFDEKFTSEGKVGLTRGGKDEEVVWKEFATNPTRCHEVAAAISLAVEESTQNSVPGQATESDVFEADEGKLLTAIHTRRERNQKLIQRKKADALKKLGKLECEVCGFDFEQVYGDRGVGFIECHHTQPLSECMGQKTRLKDLALVCANCHRMIHAKRPWLTVEELKQLFSAGGQAN